MIFRILNVVATVLFTLTFAQPSAAAIVVDQDAFVPPPSGPPFSGRVGAFFGFSSISGNIVIGQTVTAGVSGRLHSIELQELLGSRSGGATFGLTLFDGNLAAGGRAIGFVSGVLPVLPGLNQSTLVNLSDLGYHVTSGQIFSFSIGILAGPANTQGVLPIGNFSGVIPPAPPSNFVFNDYSRGVRYASFSRSPFGPRFVAQPQGDLGFRTFVDTAITGVPEPGNWAMMIIGFGVIGAAARRKRYRLRVA